MASIQGFVNGVRDHVTRRIHLGFNRESSDQKGGVTAQIGTHQAGDLYSYDHGDVSIRGQQITDPKVRTTANRIMLGATVAGAIAGTAAALTIGAPVLGAAALIGVGVAAFKGAGIKVQGQKLWDRFSIKSKETDTPQQARNKRWGNLAIRVGAGVAAASIFSVIPFALPLTIAAMGATGGAAAGAYAGGFIDSNVVKA
jgi:hypothetical protein